MSTLIIAEKPLVAQTIAKHLKATNKEKGYYYNSQYKISYALGHLVCLADAKTYVEDPWNLGSLPIVPEPFKLVKSKGKTEQLFILKKLISEASYIINATDAGREGELIFRYILEYCGGTNKKIDRLWLSSYTTKELNKGLNELKPHSAYDTLYYSAKARNQADWLFGINGTVALTRVLNSNSVLSLGRVQTPTYAMVCKRYLENKNFISKPYFTPSLLLTKDTLDFTATHMEKFDTIEQANAVIEQLLDSIVCSEATFKTSELAPPKLFNLTELQRAANRSFTFTASETLDLAQALYEKHKMITYPRTDSRYLTRAMRGEVPELLNSLKGSALFDNAITAIDSGNLRDEPFNDEQVTDHYAIIPTGIVKQDLSEDELQIYHMIVRQFIAAFSGNAVKETTNYVFTHQDQTFKSTGNVYPVLGWKALFQKEKDDAEGSNLPKVQENDVVAIKEKVSKEGKTKAPPYLTDDTLLGLMDNCGKEFEDVENKDIRKAGIGTSATRKDIINRIISVGYVKREGKKKYLIPTELGLKLYHLVKDFSMANVTLTGKWENALDKIAKGGVSYQEFMHHIKLQLQNKVLMEITGLKNQSITKKLPCPKCKTTSVTLQGRKYACLSDLCDFSIWSSVFQKPVSEGLYLQLTAGTPVPLKGLLSKEGKKFDALGTLNLQSNSIDIQFAKSSKVTQLTCPKCKTAKLVEYEKFYGCQDYKKGCKTGFPKVICAKKITPQILHTLFTHQKTPVLKNFTSKQNKSFDAMLILKPGFEIAFPPKKI